MTTKEEDEDVEEEDQEEKKTKSERLLTEALRKMAIDRRESVTARCLRRGMFSEHSSLKQRQQQQQQQQHHAFKSSSSSSSKSYLHLAAKATEMTRTQKRINRGGY
ncbi:unnamed protein product [Bathycoccus prasinos]